MQPMPIRPAFWNIPIWAEIGVYCWFDSRGGLRYRYLSMYSVVEGWTTISRAPRAKGTSFRSLARCLYA